MVLMILEGESMNRSKPPFVPSVRVGRTVKASRMRIPFGLLCTSPLDVSMEQSLGIDLLATQRLH